MTPDFNIPWERYALIAELANRLGKRGTQFGKTMLQKLVYLLQEGFDIDLGYSFELYTYGPFCTQLLIDLDQVEALQGINVVPVVSGFGGYQIDPASMSESIREKGSSLLTKPEVVEALSELIKEFGDLLAVDLELRSTIVFVAHDHSRLGLELSLGDIARIVGEIKPKFSVSQIEVAIQELSDNGYIELAD